MICLYLTRNLLKSRRRAAGRLFILYHIFAKTFLQNAPINRHFTGESVALARDSGVPARRDRQESGKRRRSRSRNGPTVGRWDRRCSLEPIGDGRKTTTERRGRAQRCLTALGRNQKWKIHRGGRRVTQRQKKSGRKPEVASGIPLCDPLRPLRCTSGTSRICAACEEFDGSPLLSVVVLCRVDDESWFSGRCFFRRTVTVVCPDAFLLRGGSYCGNPGRRSASGPA